MKRHFLFLSALAFCLAPLHGATLERLSLEDMIAKSTAIVRGKVGGSYAELSGRVIYTRYSIQVTETFKGAARGSVEVAIPGGTAGKLTQTFSGTPRLQAGEEYVFFLWTGKSGITQVIGLTQGLFSIGASGEDPVATRKASRELMLAQRTGQPVKDETLTMRLSELRTRIAAGLRRGAAQ